jgi:hypothetical protein
MSFNKDNMTAKLDSLQPLSGVCAFRPGTDVKTIKVVEGCSIASASTLARENQLDLTEATAFEKAGWKFAKMPQGVGNVVVDQGDGRMKIVADALNVKFDSSLPRSKVDSILGKYGLAVKRDYGFSPNLFVVSGGTTDAVATAKKLNSVDGIVYAEPVLIEALGRRG